MENRELKAKKALNLEEKLFTTSDGTIISYLDNNLNNRPTLFIIHGYLSSKEALLPLSLKLNEGNYRFIHVDVPGFGKSSKDPKASYKITDQAKRMNELISYLKLSNVNLVGTSMGGAISIAINGTNNDIKSNTLIAPFGMPIYTDELPGIFEYFIETGKLAFIIDNPYNEDKTMQLIKNVSNSPTFLIPSFVKKYMKERLEKIRESANKVGSDILYDDKSLLRIVNSNKRFASIKDSIQAIKNLNSKETYIKLLNKVNKNHNVKDIDPIGNNYEDLTNYLQKINNPVLVYWGNKDNIIHYKTIESIKPHLRNATFKIFKNGSHIISITKAKKIAKDINQLINQN